MGDGDGQGDGPVGHHGDASRYWQQDCGFYGQHLWAGEQSVREEGGRDEGEEEAGDA